MTAIEKKLPEMSGQVSQVLEGMDKLNAKVEDFMQQLLACRKDGVNVRNPKTVVATVNIEEVDVLARTGSPEILGVAKSLHEVLHSDLDGGVLQPHFGLSASVKPTLPKVGTWSPPGLSKTQKMI
jgi:hypothetical protein